MANSTLKSWLLRFFLLALIGAAIYVALNYNKIFNSQKKTTSTQTIDDLKPFIEVFNALEVEHLMEKLRSKDIDNLNDVIYLDYIIQKHQLWMPRKLEAYKKQKENLSIYEDKWNKLLIKAQDYKPNMLWREEYQKMEDKSIDIYMDRLEKNNPEQFKWLDSLRTGKFLDNLEGENKEQISKISKLIFPDEAKSHEETLESLKKLKDTWENEKWFNVTFRKMFRNEFEKEYLNQNI
ncbi:MAG: hypothetical protein OEZ36_04150 [Spirochaetota bacterium]|nr:hypothetical protein [Spirochaetota bacterium]